MERWIQYITAAEVSKHANAIASRTAWLIKACEIIEKELRCSSDAAIAGLAAFSYRQLEEALSIQEQPSAAYGVQAKLNRILGSFIHRNAGNRSTPQKPDLEVMMIVRRGNQLTSAEALRQAQQRFSPLTAEKTTVQSTGETATPAVLQVRRTGRVDSINRLPQLQQISA